MDITLFSATGCGKCAVVKNLLAGLKVSYAEKSIFTLSQEEIMELGLRQIPSLLVDGKLHYVGDKRMSDLKELLQIL